LKLIQNIIGEKYLINAEKRGKGIIFLTPHLGCFEITSIYYGSKKPITVMYRKARKIWMSDFMINGRKKGRVKLAPADIKGLKKVLVALNNGEAVGILPDQVADKGEGELAKFFGRPAYTMVLISKLIKRSDATIIMAYGERLKNGNGFDIHVEELKRKDIETPNDLNKQIENFIKKNPTQYYWSYDRYKSVQK
jgi:KDO2-lipid IV(A) lauroyltransferase